MKCALTQDLIIEPRFKALFLTVLILVALAAAPSLMAAPSTAAVAIAAQTDPAKLSTLKGERAANPRMQRCAYWLASVKAAGEKPAAVLDEAASASRTRPYERELLAQ